MPVCSFRNFICGLLLICVCVLVLLTASIPAIAQKTKAKRSEVQVVLLSGKTTTLTSPRMSGGFVAADFTIYNINMSAVESLVFVEVKNKKRYFQIKLRGVDQKFGVSLKGKGLFSGEGEWGKVRLSLAKVKSLKFTHHTPLKSVKIKKPWRVTLLSGLQLDVGVKRRLRLRGSIKIGNLNLNSKIIKKMVFDEENKADIFGVNNELLVLNWRPSERQLHVTHAMGSLKLNWPRIKILENLAAKPVALKNKMYRLVSKDNGEISLPLSSNVLISGRVKEIFLSFKISKIQEMKRIEAVVPRFTITLIDGRRVEGFEPGFPKLRKRKKKQKIYLSSSTALGDIQILWDDIDQISAPDRELVKVPKFAPTWILKTKLGLVLPLRRMALNKRYNSRGSINGELKVKRLNWAAFDAVRSTSKGLELQLTNQKSWYLDGSIDAKSPYGKIRLNIKDISGLVRSKSDENENNATRLRRGNKVLGRLITHSGREYPVVSSSLTGGRAVQDKRKLWGYGLHVAKMGVVEFWVKDSIPVANGYITGKRKLISPYPLIEKPLTFRNFKTVEFENRMGSFSIPLSKVKRYIALNQPASQQPKLTAKYRIRAFKGNKASAYINVSHISFARYPARAWSGRYTYSRYPFQWFRSNSLYFKRRDDSARIDVKIEKIKRIDLMKRYKSSRRATLTNHNGNQLEGSIYPGNTTKSHGVSRWSSAKEGLLGTIAKGSYVFIRFKNITAVEIEKLSP